MKQNIETFIGCDSEYAASEIVLFGAPFDSTTSFRPGTRFGPAAIRHESFGIETYSPYQDRDLTDRKIYDAGNLELPFGSPEDALTMIQETAEEILHDGKLPLMLGGEHLVTLGSFRAVYEKYPDVQVIHFDAHADLRDDYLGTRLSHACVLHRSMIWSATVRSISSASAAERKVNSSLPRDIRICMHSILSVWMKLYSHLSKQIHLSTSQSTWTVWTHPVSAVPVHQKPAGSPSCSYWKQS